MKDVRVIIKNINADQETVEQGIVKIIREENLADFKSVRDTYFVICPEHNFRQFIRIRESIKKTNPLQAIIVSKEPI